MARNITKYATEFARGTPLFWFVSQYEIHTTSTSLSFLPSLFTVIVIRIILTLTKPLHRLGGCLSTSPSLLIVLNIFIFVYQKLLLQQVGGCLSRGLEWPRHLHNVDCHCKVTHHDYDHHYDDDHKDDYDNEYYDDSDADHD